MARKWNVDIRFADGKIFSLDLPFADTARDYAKRMNRMRELQRINDIHPERGAVITGIMVWDCRKITQEKCVVVYGTEFTF